MLPIFTIVGRPNVGKSTLFNYLTKTRNALVVDIPGVTRDRQYGTATFNEKEFIVIDTGGIEHDTTDSLPHLAMTQVQQAMQEANAILFLIDAKDGLMPLDEKIAKQLRPMSDKVIVLANKADNEKDDPNALDAYRLGFSKVYAISSIRGRGIKNLLTELLKNYHPKTEEEKTDQINITVIGRPNAGKSTLINQILGENRVIVSDVPGTTRDSISVPFKHGKKNYMLIDTAGIRRRSRVHEVIEKFSIVKTLKAINRAHIVLILLDVAEKITEQDLKLIGIALNLGKGIVILFNKSDTLDEYDKKHLENEIDRRLQFAKYIPMHFISALKGTGISRIYKSIRNVYRSATADISTAQLNKTLEIAVKKHQPPLVRGRNVKLLYAHIGGHQPLKIIVHGTRIKNLPKAYQTYLQNYFRETFKLIGIPLQIECHDSRDEKSG